MSQFNSNIKVLRKKANLTPVKFSNLLCVDEEKYQQWEEGELEPDIDTLIELAFLHEVSIDELLKEDLSTRKSKCLNEKLRKKIIEEICDYFGFKLFQVKIKSRGIAGIAECRQLIYYFLYENKLGSLEQIAADLGRDHSSLIHGIKKVKDFIAVDPVFKRDFTNIQERVAEIIENEK